MAWVTVFVSPSAEVVLLLFEVDEAADFFTLLLPEGGEAVFVGFFILSFTTRGSCIKTASTRDEVLYPEFFAPPILLRRKIKNTSTASRNEVNGDEEADDPTPGFDDAAPKSELLLLLLLLLVLCCAVNVCTIFSDAVM